MTRRAFAAAVSSLTAGLAFTNGGGKRLPIRKAVYAGMLPRELSWTDRFKMARAAGFEAVECSTEPEPARAAEIRKAAEAADLPIHSVMNQSHWEYPLSSADPAVAARSIEGIRTSLRNAAAWGADTVLLVPAVVNGTTGYNEAWERSAANIRKLLPTAEKLRVCIAIENVWNKFLLSPREMAEYVDQFRSPWVKAYFDAGNILFYGFPQDWIRTLGRRIVKLHFKDFKVDRKESRYVFTRNLLEGDVDWPEVYRALAEIGFKGTATVELGAGDEAYLREVSRRFDLILTNSTNA
ncbi:MAG: sugar phosphate isomerase/epimerase family protein [bacterium]|jgi:L-ribulose-5-phosphate 3-epimerase